VVLIQINVIAALLPHDDRVVTIAVRTTG